MVHSVCIEERFLSAQTDAFTGSEREEKASARFARNDGISCLGTDSAALPDDRALHGEEF